MNKKAIEKLRDLVGLLTGNLVKDATYQRYKIGDKVKYFNRDVGAWDIGEITSVRNKNTYTVQNAEFQSSLHEWNELRPTD